MCVNNIIIVDLQFFRQARFIWVLSVFSTVFNAVPITF